MQSQINLKFKQYNILTLITVCLQHRDPYLLQCTDKSQSPLDFMQSYLMHRVVYKDTIFVNYCQLMLSYSKKMDFWENLQAKRYLPWINNYVYTWQRQRCIRIQLQYCILHWPEADKILPCDFKFQGEDLCQLHLYIYIYIYKITQHYFILKNFYIQQFQAVKIDPPLKK